jgi:hypothetical protein
MGKHVSIFIGRKEASLPHYTVSHPRRPNPEHPLRRELQFSYSIKIICRSKSQSTVGSVFW